MSATDTTGQDAAILFPDETLTLAGEEVMVREFRYAEGLRAAALARPLLAGLRALIEAQGDIEPEALDGLIGEHQAVWVDLLAMSAGRDAEWVGGLTDRDGLALSMAFWRANGPFFTRRLVVAAALAEGLGGLSRSRRSSASSPPQDTAPDTTTSPGG